MKILLSLLTLFLLSSSLRAAEPAKAQPQPAAKPAVDLRRQVQGIVAVMGRTAAHAEEVETVFRNPADGPAALPVSVRIKALDAHPPTYVRGEPVRLEVEETGDVRERHWSIEPRVLWPCHPDHAKLDRVLWFSSPTSGTYTVVVTSVGRTSGIATDKFVITIVDTAAGASQLAASPGAVQPLARPAETGDSPEAIVRRALAKVPSEARQAELDHVREVLSKSNNLSEARAFLLGPRSLGVEKIAAWQPLLVDLEKMFDSLRDAGRIPTAANERGAMERVAKALE